MASDSYVSLVSRIMENPVLSAEVRRMMAAPLPPKGGTKMDLMHANWERTLTESSFYAALKAGEIRFQLRDNSNKGVHWTRYLMLYEDTYMLTVMDFSVFQPRDADGIVIPGRFFLKSYQTLPFRALGDCLPPLEYKNSNLFVPNCFNKCITCRYLIENGVFRPDNKLCASSTRLFNGRDTEYLSSQSLIDQFGTGGGTHYAVVVANMNHYIHFNKNDMKLSFKIDQLLVIPEYAFKAQTISEIKSIISNSTMTNTFASKVDWEEEDNEEEKRPSLKRKLESEDDDETNQEFVFNMEQPSKKKKMIRDANAAGCSKWTDPVIVEEEEEAAKPFKGKVLLPTFARTQTNSTKYKSTVHEISDDES